MLANPTFPAGQDSSPNLTRGLAREDEPVGAGEGDPLRGIQLTIVITGTPVT